MPVCQFQLTISNLKTMIFYILNRIKRQMGFEKHSCWMIDYFHYIRIFNPVTQFVQYIRKRSCPVSTEIVCTLTFAARQHSGIYSAKCWWKAMNKPKFRLIYGTTNISQLTHWQLPLFRIYEYMSYMYLV